MAGYGRGRRAFAARVGAVLAVVGIVGGGYLALGDSDDDVQATPGRTSPTTSVVPAPPGTAPRGIPFVTVEEDGSLDLGVVGRLEGQPSGDGPVVAMLGDSVLHPAREQLRAALEGKAVIISALLGEGVAEGNIGASFPDATMRGTAERYAALEPEVVVIALGTNDVRHPQYDTGAALQALGDIRGSFDDACIVTVTVAETSRERGYDTAKAQQFNAKLTELGDVVVPWHREGATDPANLFLGGVHLSETGKTAYAVAVAEGVRACAD